MWRVGLLVLPLIAVPEKGAGAAPSPAAEGGRMVVTAHPLATEAGLWALREGGTALDAAIAAQMVLTLVEPAESGIGGGGFLLHRSAATGALDVYDGRETAPAAATPDRFMLFGRIPMPFPAAVIGGRSVGVPGLVAMLHLAHREHGRLPWDQLFEPAIRLAGEGFPVSPRLHRQIVRDPSLLLMPGTRRYFHVPLGHALPPGAILRNPALAETLRRIAAEGPTGFYAGPVAEAMVAAVRRPWLNKGDLALADLAGYEPRRREAVCRPYRAWTVCGAPPPSSGGVAVLQILGMLERFDLPAMPADSLEAVHLIAEASRLAFADRAAYLADPDYVEVPGDRLLDRDYLAERAAKIRMDEAIGPVPVGIPPGLPVDEPPPPDPGPEGHSTTHLSILDAEGNVVALTSSLEAPFGSRLMVEGFLLNNQLTDFAFRPEVDGMPVANRVEPGKRPRSSMAPTLVFDAEGRLRLVIGSPGGPRIIGYVVKALVGVLDWDLDVQEAVALPNFLHRGDELELERGTVLEGLVGPLRALGHRVRVRPLASGLHGIAVTADGLRGGVDPRREGLALGD